MKPILYSTSLLFLLCGLAVAAPTHLDIAVPDRIRDNLKGPVKSVLEDTCRNESENHTKVLTEYDEDGNITAIKNWGGDGDLLNATTNHYDENGCFVSSRYESYGKKGITNDWTVVLNPATRQIARKNGRTGAISLRTYSPAKRLLSYRYMDKGKKLKSASRNQWNTDSSRRTEFTKYDESNKPLYTYWFKWKGDGFIDKERQRYHQEKKERLHEYEYLAVDGHGNWTQQLMVRYDIGGRGNKENVYECTTVRTIEYYDHPNPEGENGTP